MNKFIIKDILWGLVFLVLQFILVRHLRIFETEANLFWIYIVFIAAKRTRYYSILLTATLAFIFDALLDSWGLHLFSMVLIIFAVYQLLPRLSESKLLSGQVFVVLGISCFLLNGCLIILSNFIDLYSSDIFVWQRLIGNSIYTALLGTFLYNFNSASRGSSI